MERQLPSEGGICPDKLLWEIFRRTRCSRKPMDCGIDPIRWFFDKSKLKRVVIFASPTGIYPSRLLKDNFRIVNR